jgi:hypothetical protein
MTSLLLDAMSSTPIATSGDAGALRLFPDDFNQQTYLQSSIVREAAVHIAAAVIANAAKGVLDTVVFDDIEQPPRSFGRDTIEAALVLVLDDLRSMPRGFTAERVERRRNVTNYSHAVSLHLVVTLHTRRDVWSAEGEA